MFRVDYRRIKEQTWKTAGTYEEADVAREVRRALTLLQSRIAEARIVVTAPLDDLDEERARS